MLVSVIYCTHFLPDCSAYAYLQLLLLFFFSLVMSYRYGPIFKTNLIGRPVVAITDPELVYYVLKQEGRLFESWYPETFTEVFGRTNVGSLHGFMYKYLKTLILRLYGPENLKSAFLPDIEKSCHATFQSWSSRSCFDLKEALSVVSTLIHSLFCSNICLFSDVIN